MLRNVQKNSHRCERRYERRSAIRNKRKRNSFSWQQRKHDADVEERLRHDARHDAKTQQHSKSVRCQQCSAYAPPQEKSEDHDDSKPTNQAKFLTDYGEDKIRMRER